MRVWFIGEQPGRGLAGKMEARLRWHDMEIYRRPDMTRG